MRTTTIYRHTIDSLILTHLMKPALACFTHAVVPTVPSPTNPITDFPSLLRGGHCYNVPDNFVAWNAGA